jgi:hypothetical protein
MDLPSDPEGGLHSILQFPADIQMVCYNFTRRKRVGQIGRVRRRVEVEYKIGREC